VAVICPPDDDLIRLASSFVGRHAFPCPKCGSGKRRSPRSLVVFSDALAFIFNCGRCGWKGGARFSSFDARRHRRARRAISKKRFPRDPLPRATFRSGSITKKDETMSRLSEVTKEQRNQLRENSEKMTGGTPFIKYEWEKGEFRLGDKDVTNTDYLAIVDRAEAVWICFLNGTVKDLVRVNMMDGELPLRPKGYDDRDKWEKWEKGKDAGKPKDPLMFQFELPLITNDNDARVIIFKASAKLGKGAVSRLLDAVNANETLQRPFVTLSVAPNPDNINQMLPDFTIDGYSDNLADIVLPWDKPDKSANGSGAAPTNGGGAASSRNSDMDDDIPF
jgi:hypothetical protein